VLASHTVQVTIEAKARPINTAFTTGSALRYIPHGLRSRGSVAVATTLSCASAADGSASHAISAVAPGTAALNLHGLRKRRACRPCLFQSCISADLFFCTRWQVARCYNATYQVLATIRPSRRRRNLRSVIGPYVGRIEFVVDAGTQDVLGDVGIEGDRGRRTRRRRWDGRDRSQIEVEVLDLGGPIAGQTAFDSAADRPARLGVVAADDRIDRIAVAVEPEDRAGGHHFAHRQPAGDVSNGIRRRDDAEPAAQGCEPFQLLTLLELGDHRGIVDDANESRLADGAGAYGVELCALARGIQVSLDAGEQHPAGEPVVADLVATDRAIEPARGGGREQPGSARRIAEDGVGIGLAGAVPDGAAEIGTGPGPCREHRRFEQHGRS